MSNFLAISLLGACFIALFCFIIYIATNKPTIKPPQFSMPNIIFSSGSGGVSGNASKNNNPLQSGGGGGAGGLTISYNSNTFYNKQAEKGKDEGFNFGGMGGKGFGAGGGGAGCLSSFGATIGGKGNDGFVYIIEDNILITSSVDYIVKSSSLNINIILMGGGGGGGGVLNDDPTNYPVKTGGNGGCAGNIIRATNINSVPGSKLRIIIGKGGTSGQNGENTSVTNNDLQISLISYGGFNGNNILPSTLRNNSITVNTPQSAGSAIGSKFTQLTGISNINGSILVNGSGGIVNRNTIYLLNNIT